jgi:hypothetical protein
MVLLSKNKFSKGLGEANTRNSRYKQLMKALLALLPVSKFPPPHVTRVRVGCVFFQVPFF